ncbi:MAG: AAA family ATPase [Pirellulales bacterium]|nr:AAA family ATPase [Pirellulales bacterium]
MAQHDANAFLADFRHALNDCRKLYLDAGQKIVTEYPNLIQGQGATFVQKMDNLHKALLVKVYITICEADRHWSHHEQRLAEILFQHAWDRQLEGESLREAVREVAKKSTTLRWYSLIRPFDQIAPLREDISRLETVVLRVANIIARADGSPLPNVLTHIKHLQNQLTQNLRYIPIDEPSQHAEADKLRGQAIAKVEHEASRVRTQCELAEEPALQESQKSREERLQEALAKLDALIGLDNIKREVHTLINFLKIQKERARAGLSQTVLSLHMVFNGNPGTGKTTVARILGQIFGAMDILEKGHVIETDRSGLVAEYAGQTGPKTNKKIDEANGGVLFIDEAYSLVASEGEDPFGHEAVQTLLKRMEDSRDRVVVILAGYPDQMNALLASNPGLSSRFSRQLSFTDYTPSELCRIFDRMCRANEYRLLAPARVKLMLGLDWLYTHRDRHFGNGRTVRNIFEHSIRRLADRIAEIQDLTRDHLTIIEQEDIEFVGRSVLPSGSDPTKRDPFQHVRTCLADFDPSDPARELAALFVNLDDTSRRFAVRCPGCQQVSHVPQTYLCRRVVCKKCQQSFTVDWGEIIKK